MPHFIIADTYIQHICKTQGIDYDKVNRIIIDARSGEPVLLYVTMIGDEELLLTAPEVIEPEITVT